MTFNLVQLPLCHPHVLGRWILLGLLIVTPTHHTPAHHSPAHSAPHPPPHPPPHLPTSYQHSIHQHIQHRIYHHHHICLVQRCCYYSRSTIKKVLGCNVEKQVVYVIHCCCESRFCIISGNSPLLGEMPSHRPVGLDCYWIKSVIKNQSVFCCRFPSPLHMHQQFIYQHSYSKLIPNWSKCRTEKCKLL